MSAKHILIVDDDSELLQGLKLRLEAMGFLVSTAENGLDAVLKFSKTPPDLFIVDIGLPEADGFKVLIHLRSKGYKNVPVIVYTGRSDNETKQLCEKMGASFVSKELKWEEQLLPLIAEVLVEDNSSTALTPKALPDSPNGSPPTVLLIDDDQDITRAMGQRLRKYQIHTVEATAGAEGFNMALKHMPDIIITDYSMPEGGADYLIMRLRQCSATKHIPVFVLTGKTVAGEKDHALSRELLSRGGVAAFLTKPIDFEDLLGVINPYLQAPRVQEHLQASL